MISFDVQRCLLQNNCMQALLYRLYFLFLMQTAMGVCLQKWSGNWRLVVFPEENYLNCMALLVAYSLSAISYTIIPYAFNSILPDAYDMHTSNMTMWAIIRYHEWFWIEVTSFIQHSTEVIFPDNLEHLLPREWECCSYVLPTEWECCTS